jgi:ABC-type transporter Mla subunit MlaD
MPNDDLAVKLSNLEGLITGMSQRFTKLEEAIEKVVSLDRTVAEFVVRHEGTQRELRELANDLRAFAQASKTTNDLLGQRLTATERDYFEFKNKTAGVLLALKVFSGSCATAIILSGSWVYDKVESNRTMNYEQSRDIKELRDQIQRLEQRKIRII